MKNTLLFWSEVFFCGLIWIKLYHTISKFGSNSCSLVLCLGVILPPWIVKDFSLVSFLKSLGIDGSSVIFPIWKKNVKCSKLVISKIKGGNLSNWVSARVRRVIFSALLKCIGNVNSAFNSFVFSALDLYFSYFHQKRLKKVIFE